MQLSSEVDRLNSLLEKYGRDKSQTSGENDQLRSNLNALQGRLEQIMAENKRANDELRNTQEGSRNYTLQIQELNAKLVQMVSERDDLGRRMGQLG